jgi:UDP-glucose-4-epimerase GalE
MHFASFIEAGESVTDPARFYANNVVGTLNVLHAMRRAHVDRIVFSSSAAVYGTPDTLPIAEHHKVAPVSPYGTTKSICEAMLRDFAGAYGIRSISLRYFNAAGADPEAIIGEAHDPETHLIPLVLEAAAGIRPCISIFGDRYNTSDGTCCRDYVHVSDLADAHISAMHRLESGEGAQVFNLGTGRGATVYDVIAAARRVTHRAIPVRIVSPRSGDPASLVADPSMARSKLGWVPEFPELEIQIGHAWQWFRRYRSITRRHPRCSTVVPFPATKGRPNGARTDFHLSDSRVGRNAPD